MRKYDVLAVLAVFMLSFVLGTVAVQHDKPEQPISVLIPTKTVQFVTIEEGPRYSKDDLACMQENIYFEARTESAKGQKAIALVTLARVKTKHFPATVCGVVRDYVVKKGKRRCQFSWYCDGKSDQPNMKNVAERAAWEEAGEIAQAALEGKVHDFLGNATNYHATYVTPAWTKDTKRIKRLAQIGAHIFYKDIALRAKA